MPSFTYTAKDSGGATLKGALDAENRKGALRQLSARGLTPVRLQEGAAPTGGRAAASAATAADDDAEPARVSPKAAQKLSRRDRLPFLRALADLVTCGVQTGDAVRMLSRRLSSGRLKTLAVAMWDGLSQGQSLSGTMRAHPAVFDEASSSLIEAGEATGNLGEILKRLVADLEARDELRAKVVNAMAYPIFIVLVAVAVILMFLFFLLPRIQTLLTSLGGKLPLATRMLIGLSELMITWGPVLAIGLAFGSVAIVAWRRTAKGRDVLDQRVLGLPGLGPFLRDADLLRMVQTLALLLENGITTITALALTERTILNTTIRRTFSDARLKIAEGMHISHALRNTGYFPDLITDILIIGDNTGNIVPGLQEVARYYRKRQAQMLGLFINVLSVGVLMFAFAFVALIAFGIILAVFQLSSNLSAR